MRYPAVITTEGKHVLAEFPDCPGCQTFVEMGEEIEPVAQEALEGWLESHLVSGRLPPEPARRSPAAPRGGRVIWVNVSPKLSIKIDLRRARQRAGLTQADLAKLTVVSQPMIAQLEDPDYNPTVDMLEKVARPLGVRLLVALEKAPEDAGGPRASRPPRRSGARRPKRAAA